MVTSLLFFALTARIGRVKPRLTNSTLALTSYNYGLSNPWVFVKNWNFFIESIMFLVIPGMPLSLGKSYFLSKWNYLSYIIFLFFSYFRLILSNPWVFSWAVDFFLGIWKEKKPYMLLMRGLYEAKQFFTHLEYPLPSGLGAYCVRMYVCPMVAKLMERILVIFLLCFICTSKHLTLMHCSFFYQMCCKAGRILLYNSFYPFITGLILFYGMRSTIILCYAFVSWCLFISIIAS